MKKALLSMTAAIAVATLSVSPVTSGEVSPVGTWQSSTGESRYEVSLCGSDKLCARLTWLRSDARTAENMAYLNKYIVRGARPVSENKWRGTIDYAGEKIGGSVTLVNADRMRLNACMLIACQSVDFHRI